MTCSKTDQRWTFSLTFCFHLKKWCTLIAHRYLKFKVSVLDTFTTSVLQNLQKNLAIQIKSKSETNPNAGTYSNTTTHPLEIDTCTGLVAIDP